MLVCMSFENLRTLRVELNRDFSGKIKHPDINAHACCNIGSGRRNHNEDRFFSSVLRPINRSSSEEILKSSFDQTHASVNDEFSGSTCTTAMLNADNSLTIGQLGDSAAILFIRNPETGKFTAKKLTNNHNTDNPVEIEFARERGAIFLNYHGCRILHTSEELPDPLKNTKVITWEDFGKHYDGAFGALITTRGFGDSRFKKISRTPEIKTFDLSQYDKQDLFLCVCSDGLKFDRPDGLNKMCELLEYLYANNKMQQAASMLCAQSVTHFGSSDNVTNIFTPLPNQSLKLSYAFGVADGHGGELAASAVSKIMPSTIREIAENQHSKALEGRQLTGTSQAL